MSERDLWMQVAILALTDAQKLIEAERRKISRIRIDGEMKTAVTRDAVGQARRYFDSRDWREVCDLAGWWIDPDRAMEAVTTGAVPRMCGGWRT